MSAEFNVHVTPKSSRSQLEIQPDGSLKAWLHAPPADGAANAALIELLAKALRVPKSTVAITRGETSRRKRVRIEGIELSELRNRLS